MDTSRCNGVSSETFGDNDGHKTRSAERVSHSTSPNLDFPHLFYYSRLTVHISSEAQVEQHVTSGGHASIPSVCPPADACQLGHEQYLGFWHEQTEL